jgi:putative (di)nucleoside polyphosphate hydrolase
MRFLGEEGEIDISPRNGHKAEFEAWRWAKMTEIPELIIPFKRQVYRDVVSIFAPYVA